MPKTKDRIMSKPVVIPSSINMNSTKKLSKIKPQPEKEENYQKLELNNGNIKEQKKNEKYSTIEQNIIPEEPIVQPKRGRGRPRKILFQRYKNRQYLLKEEEVDHEKTLFQLNKK